MYSSLIFFLAQSVGGQYAPYQSVYGAHDLDHLGTAEIVGLGDINGDGRGDFIAGDPFSTAEIVNLYSGNDLSILRSHDNGAIGSFGQHVGNAGDVNADGINDYLIANTTANPGGLTFAGEVYLYSGATGALMHTISGQNAGDAIGYVDSAGDINGDGFDDFMVGGASRDYGGLVKAGVLTVYSGATFQILHESQGNTHFSLWGSAIDGGFDLNQDGFDDFISGSSDESLVIVYSGMDGSVMFSFSAPILDRMGNAVCLTPDSNADGHPDFSIAAFHKDLPGNPLAGQVNHYSGLDGSLLFTFDGRRAGDQFGSSITYAGDLDGNGNPNIAISSIHASTGFASSGTIQVFDLTTGEQTAIASGSQLWGGLGTSLSWVGDTDGNGVDNLLASEASYSSPGLSQNGAVHVMRFHPALILDQSSLSASLGGTVNFAIDFPEHSVGTTYRLLASHQGVGPTVINGLEIPLTNLGIVWHAMVSSPPPSFFSNSIGTLDASGNASAQLSLPPGAANRFLGGVLHFAVVSLYPSGIGRQSSVAVPLMILP